MVDSILDSHQTVNTQFASVPSIDFSHVDVGNLTSEAVDILDNSELDQYLPPSNPASATIVSSSSGFNQPHPGSFEVASPVNAIYAWSNKYITSLQYGSSKCSNPSKFEEINSYSNGNDALPSSKTNDNEYNPQNYDHCMYQSPYQPYTYPNHTHQFQSLFQWPYN